MANQGMLEAAAIWAGLSLWLLILWGGLHLALGCVGRFSDTIEQKRGRIVRAFRWVWLLPLQIAGVILALAFVWD